MKPKFCTGLSIFRFVYKTAHKALFYLTGFGQMLNKKPFDKNIRHYIQRFTQNLVNLIIAIRRAQSYTITNEAAKRCFNG